MSGKEKLMYLLEHYQKGNYATVTFTDEFDRIYNFETDDDSLSSEEERLMGELAIITSRFSEFEEDLKIPNMYFSEKDVKRKVKEIYSKLI